VENTYKSYRLNPSAKSGVEYVENGQQVIQSREGLAALCERLREARVLCIDTEFAREGRYYPELGTIQIAGGAEVALIDPIAVRDLNGLLPLLVDPEVVKVVHAGEQDLEIFYRLLGHPVTPLFDTQVAAAFLGYGDQVSLRSLLQSTLGEHLEKEHTFTDWLRRPLSASQVEYALNDVRSLGRLYEMLRDRLTAKGRLAWAEEEFRQSEAVENFLPSDERQAYLGLKGAERLNPTALGLLQEVAAWREVTARRLNMPARKIMIDPVLVELAMRPRSSVRQLGEVRGFSPWQAEKYGAEILEALRRGAHNEPPAIQREESFPSALDSTVDFLSLCLRSVAQEHSISTGTLASRTDLRLLITLGETANIALLRGWRRQLVGSALLGALKGDVEASIVAESKQVRLQWRHAL